jgi:hypothetical protein
LRETFYGSWLLSLSAMQSGEECKLSSLMRYVVLSPLSVSERHELIELALMV